MNVVAPAPTLPEYTDPCVPTPCGPYSQCRDIGGQPSCSCLPEYTGQPPNCRPECVINPECPSNKACMKEKCRDPCPGSCGAGAQCSVINHTPTCSCPAGYTGDPFTNCYPAPPPARKLTVTFDCVRFFFCRREVLRVLMVLSIFSPTASGAGPVFPVTVRSERSVCRWCVHVSTGIPRGSLRDVSSGVRPEHGLSKG